MRGSLGSALFAFVAMTVLAYPGVVHGAPMLVDVSPSSGPTSGGTTITLTGSGFDPAGNTVKLEQNDCPVTSENTTEIHCKTTAGVGQGLRFQVFTSGGVSNTQLFSYDPPSSR